MTEFVTSSEFPDWGIGRVIDVDIGAGTVDVEYFQSPLEGGLEVTVDRESVRPRELARQTRVYVQARNGGYWTPGRILEDGAVEASALDRERYPEAPERGYVYLVGFPKGMERAFLPEEIHVRWGQPISDPTKFLASKTHDGPFLYQKRSRVLREIFHQRAIFLGMTSLASSSIELYEHQVRAVRRILSDPIKRYILADEVGLGKTIEAGILIRQHLLDNPRSGQTLVVVPPHLRVQWQDELKNRINLTGTLEARVLAITPEEVAKLPKQLKTYPTQLVVDEAHQICRFAFSDLGEGRQIYQRLEEIARASEEVFLLSATPVLRNEDGFLAMLHLLDPGIYRLEERDQFHGLIKRSMAVADLVASLTPKQNPALLRRTLRDIDEHLVGDERVAQIAAQLTPLLDSSRDSPARQDMIGNLRLHLQETHRLHRRLIRTPRSDPSADEYLPAGRLLEPRPFRDSVRMAAFENLEDWRFKVLDQESHPSQETRAARIFCEWVKGSLAAPGSLKGLIYSRLSALTAREEEPFFDDETDLLERALADLELPDTDYIKHLTAVIRERVRILGDKGVLFSSDKVLADRLASELSGKVPGTLIRHSPMQMHATEEFERNNCVSLLLVDRDGEEGLNLQRVKSTIIHADLPISPMRVEQRIGRIDRLRSKSVKVVSLVPYADSGYEKAVFDFLVDTGVFSESIAPLQFLLDEVLQGLYSHLLAEGTDAFNRVRQEMSDPNSPLSLETEARNNRRMQALDEMGRSTQEKRYYQELEDYEYGEGAKEFSSVVSSWLGDGCLGLKQESDEGRSRFSYSPSRTQLPKREFLTFFGESIDRQLHGARVRPSTFRLAFDRATSVQRNTPLARIGHSVIDAIERQIRSEERGVAFAVWRQVQKGVSAAEPNLFFRFDFLIEASVEEGNQFLRRRADSLFPPAFQPVWLGPQFDEIQDESLLAVLEAPFGGEEEGISDTTLRAGDTWLRAEEFIPGAWPDLCERAFHRADEVVRLGETLRKVKARAREALEREYSHTETILLARANRMGANFGAADLKALKRETALFEDLKKAIEDPTIRLEFVGAIFLSHSGLPGEEFDE